MIPALIFCAILQVALTFEEQCQSQSGCFCTFEEPSMYKTKDEFIATAIGALSPLLITGAGFGIWKIFLSKAMPTPELSRENSNLSDYSDSPKGRNSEQGSPVTNSTRASSRVSAWSKSTALTLNDMDAEFDYDSDRGSVYKSPNDSPRWTSRQIKPSSVNTAPVLPAPASSADLNGWMF